MKEKEQRKNKRGSQHPPLKPKHPDMQGAPNDKDPEAQYENKDES